MPPTIPPTTPCARISSTAACAHYAISAALGSHALSATGLTRFCPPLAGKGRRWGALRDEPDSPRTPPLNRQHRPDLILVLLHRLECALGHDRVGVGRLGETVDGLARIRHDPRRRTLRIEFALAVCLQEWVKITPVASASPKLLVLALQFLDLRVEAA